MKISILGKIFFWIFFATLLVANVTSSVNKKTFFLGDSVTFSIQGSGTNIEFPTITSIEGFAVTGTSQSQQISYINGKNFTTKVIQYTFEPTDSITIKPLSIKVDGKEFFTQPIDIKMVEPTASKENDPIVLRMETEKNTYYKNEPIFTTVTFKYTKDAGVIDAKLLDFSPEKFWVKQLKNPEPKEENGYIVYTLNSILFAKENGVITIPNHAIKVARQSGRSFMQWDKVFSNKLQLDIKPLPNNLNIVGDFTIKASVDRNETNQNDAINLTIFIEGVGNIEDISEFKLNQPNQVLYSSKPIVKTDVIHNKLMGEFSQKISIVSDSDYTIAPIRLEYFDLETKSIKTIQTQPINIKINKTLQKEIPKIETLSTKPIIETQKEVQYIKEDGYLKYLFALGGLIVGLFLGYLLTKKKKESIEYKETPLSQKIQKAKGDKALYDILTPHIKDSLIKEYIILLEENIYKNSSHFIDKKTLITYIKEQGEI